LQKHFSKDDFFWAEDFQPLKPEVFPHLLLEPMDIGIFIIGIFVSDSKEFAVAHFSL
jgi:hypothetical protein